MHKHKDLLASPEKNFCLNTKVISRPPAELPKGTNIWDYSYQIKEWNTYQLNNWLCRTFPEVFMGWKFISEKDFDKDRFNKVIPNLTNAGLFKEFNMMKDENGELSENMVFGFSCIILYNNTDSPTIAKPAEKHCIVVWRKKAFNQFTLPVPRDPNNRDKNPIGDNDHKDTLKIIQILDLVKKCYKDSAIILACGGSVEEDGRPDVICFRNAYDFDETLQLYVNKEGSERKNQRHNLVKAGCGSKINYIPADPLFRNFRGGVIYYARKIFR